MLVNSKERFEAALAGDSFDIILSDYNVPGYDGIAAVRLAQEQQPDVPVIIISGSLGEAEAVKCLHAGATETSHPLLKEDAPLKRLGARRAAGHSGGGGAQQTQGGGGDGVAPSFMTMGIAPR